MKDFPFKGMQAKLAAATQCLMQAKLSNFLAYFTVADDVKEDASNEEFLDVESDPDMEITTTTKVLEANLVSDIHETIDWVLDSRSNTHLTGDEANLTSIVPLTHSSRVTTTGGPALTIKGKGTLDFSGNHFCNILYVPLAHRNLLSIDKLVDLDNTICFSTSKCSIYDKHHCLRLTRY